METTDIRRLSVLDLARRYAQAGPHPRHVARLALALFDQTESLHGLGERDRGLLEYAALLHDIGKSVAEARHELHSHRLILQGDLRGFRGKEVAVIALVALYHRKRWPKKRDPELRSVRPAMRSRVKWLAALLRLADALDRSKAQRIQEVTCSLTRSRLGITARARCDIELEIAAGARRARYLARLAKRNVHIVAQVESPALHHGSRSAAS
jgi:exopolyphosphatase/guanosine-5'-triphosphate,3'-diphosphate pyrophosphatase